jgi:hypothetical protein
MRRHMDRLRELPPVPHVIRAHHSVPYGRAFKQWDTAGRLIVWANRGEIKDMLRQPAKPRSPFDLVPPGVFGIRVVYEP